ncbi:MAG: type II TA system antitoxin MqsA family protein [Phycisphaerales bacterium]
MKHDSVQTPARPFPWRCHACAKDSIHGASIEHLVVRRHEGVTHKVVVENLSVGRCDECSELVFHADSDRQIEAALRDHLGLLSAGEIAAGRAALGLSQVAMADALGVAAESLCRWEKGHVMQSRSTDRMLRTFLAVPEMREFLHSLDGESIERCPSEWTSALVDKLPRSLVRPTPPGPRPEWQLAA